MVTRPDQVDRTTGEKKPVVTGRETKKLGRGSLAGNLTYDPELRYTQNGRAVTKLRVATTERKQNSRTGEWEDGPREFFDVTCWGMLGENCCEHLLRGDRIVAEGEWESRSWEDKDGNVQEAIQLVARDVGPSLLFRGARPVRPERKKAGR